MYVWRGPSDWGCARAKTAKAQRQVNEALGSVDIMDPLSEVNRFEEKVHREEARVRGQAELSMSSLDKQFESLEGLADDAEIEARMAAIKAGE